MFELELVRKPKKLELVIKPSSNLVSSSNSSSSQAFELEI